MNEIAIVGGKLSTPGKVEQELKSVGARINRLNGRDRFETSVEVVRCLYPNVEKILIANG